MHGVDPSFLRNVGDLLFTQIWMTLPVLLTWVMTIALSTMSVHYC